MDQSSRKMRVVRQAIWGLRIEVSVLLWILTNFMSANPICDPFLWSYRQNANKIESWSQRSWPQWLEIGTWQFAPSRLLNFQLYCSLKRDWLTTTLFYTTEKFRLDSQRDELRHLQDCVVPVASCSIGLTLDPMTVRRIGWSCKRRSESDVPYWNERTRARLGFSYGAYHLFYTSWCA